MSNIGITTVDNPFDPFTQFKEWYAYDIALGYNTCDHLARLTASSSDLSDEDNELDMEQAVDAVIETDMLDVYRKVRRK